MGGDQDGYLTTPAFQLETVTYSVTAEELEFAQAPADWTPWGDRLGLRVTVSPSGGAVFVGIARRADVTTYLDGIAHDEVQRLDLPGATYQRQEGQASRPPRGPAIALSES